MEESSISSSINRLKSNTLSDPCRYITAMMSIGIVADKCISMRPRSYFEQSTVIVPKIETPPAQVISDFIIAQNEQR